MIFELITRGILWIIKSIFELLSFFLRMLFKVLRLFWVLLPVTGIVYSLFFLSLLIDLFAGENILAELTPLKVDSGETKRVLVENGRGYLSMMSEYSGSLLYFVLLFVLLLLLVPMLLLITGFGAFSFAGHYLLYPLLIDLVIYLVAGVITGMGPWEQILSRYRVLFPKSGRKLDEKSYHKWLRKHHNEFENDTFYQDK